MKIGAQVRQAGGFLAALQRGESMGAEVLQLFAQSNRQWRMPQRDDDTFDAFRGAVTKSRVVSATVCHAPYLINVISPDRITRTRSAASLVANLRAATALGASGLVLHPGSHRGVAGRTATTRIGRAVAAALDEAASDKSGAATGTCGVWFENTAGSGDTVGRTFDELAELIDATAGDPRVGICIDTQHLWAAGMPFTTIDEADALIESLDRTVGLARLRCVHINDSKVPFGAQTDRHANLEEGTIGRRPLRALLGHPALQGLPAVLEIPGDGKGPRREDIVRARALVRAGVAARRRRDVR